jgi:hypothetical protein
VLTLLYERLTTCSPDGFRPKHAASPHELPRNKQLSQRKPVSIYEMPSTETVLSNNLFIIRICEHTVPCKGCTVQNGRLVCGSRRTVKHCMATKCNPLATHDCLMTGRLITVYRWPLHLRPNWFLYDGRKASRRKLNPYFPQGQCYKLAFRSWKHQSITKIVKSSIQHDNWTCCANIYRVNANT